MPSFINMPASTDSTRKSENSAGLNSAGLPLSAAADSMSYVMTSFSHHGRYFRAWTTWRNDNSASW